MSRAKCLTLCVIILIAAVALTAFSTRRVTAQRQSQISEQLTRQINSLNQEKESRTPTQQKIDSHLLYAMKQSRGEAITSEVRSLQVKVNSDVNGLVLVDIKAKVSDKLLKDIVAQGGEVVFQSASFNSITARLPLNSLETIAGSPEVQFIHRGDRARTQRASTPTSAAQRLSGVAGDLFKNKDSFLQPALRPGFVERAERVRSNLKTALVNSAHSTLSTGPVTSEGDTTHKAAAARSTFNVNGTGVKIGVISDAVDSLASQQAAGELPAVTVLPGQAGFGGDEGTAMLEIIHDLAPGAQLFFATGFTSKASFAQNILDLRAAGCDIIVDDLQYFAEGVFQDDDLARAVNTVTAAGAMYFSAAGDQGNKDDSTSSVWEGDFADSGTGTVGSITLPGGTLHDFGGGVLGNQITGNGAFVALFWSDPLGGSANDYDLYIVDSTGTTLLDASTDIQNGSQDPFEGVFFPGGNRLLIFKKTGAAPRALHLNVFLGQLTISTAGQIYGHSAAADAFSVAATPAAAFAAPPNPAGPYPGPFTSANVSALSTSDGPRRIFYDPQGNPITPNNFLFATNGGTVRQKPDITAADGVSTAVTGFNPFFGTSAAAPHAAAIAALLKSASPSATNAQIRTALTSSAIDIEDPGTDRDTGAGIVMAYEALQALGLQPVLNAAGTSLVSESCPPANAAVDPGETVTVTLNISNTGGAPTTNLVGTLQSSANVLAPSGPQTYGAIAPATTVGRNFTFHAEGNCGDTIQLTLQLQDGANNLGTITFNVLLGSASLGSTTNTIYSGSPVAIPDSNAAGVNIPLTVSGITGPIGMATFSFDGATCTSAVGATTVGLDHSWVGDLVVKLTSPTGTTITLMNNPGGVLNSGNNFCHTVLDDIGVNEIQNIAPAGAPWQGTFKPAEALSAFNGENPNGTWILNVSDNAAFDVGSVRAFSLKIAPTVVTCTAGCAPSLDSAGSTLVNESCPPSNGFIDPGEAATVNLKISNTGGGSATNLVATLQSSAHVLAPSGPQTYGAITPGTTVGRDFTFTAAGTCGSTFPLTLQLQDGANDLGTLTFSVTLGNQVTAGSAIVKPYTGPSVPIPDSNAAGVNIPLTVSGIPDRIGDANFSFDGSTCTSTVGSTTVGLDHTWVGDLVVKLTSPAGTTITLMNRPGGTLNSGNNFCHTLLDDSGVNAIQNISPAGNPWQGTFKPAEALSAFNGEDPNGTWTLNVSDNAVFDVGSVRAFSLIITPATFSCNASCAGVARIVASSVVSCDGGNTAAAITLSNSGTATVNGLMLTTAKLGGVNGTPLPQGPFTLAPGASTTVNVTFSGAPNGSTTLQLGGTFSGGTYSVTRRLNAPNCSAAALFFPTTPSNFQLQPRQNP